MNKNKKIMVIMYNKMLVELLYKMELLILYGLIILNLNW